MKMPSQWINRKSSIILALTISGILRKAWPSYYIQQLPLIHILLDRDNSSPLLAITLSLCLSKQPQKCLFLTSNVSPAVFPLEAATYFFSFQRTYAVCATPITAFFHLNETTTTIRIERYNLRCRKAPNCCIKLSNWSTGTKVTLSSARSVRVMLFRSPLVWFSCLELSISAQSVLLLLLLVCYNAAEQNNDIGVIRLSHIVLPKPIVQRAASYWLTLHPKNELQTSSYKPFDKINSHYGNGSCPPASEYDCTQARSNCAFGKLLCFRWVETPSGPTTSAIWLALSISVV